MPSSGRLIVKEKHYAKWHNESGRGGGVLAQSLITNIALMVQVDIARSVVLNLCVCHLCCRCCCCCCLSYRLLPAIHHRCFPRICRSRRRMCVVIDVSFLSDSTRFGAWVWVRPVRKKRRIPLHSPCVVCSLPPLHYLNVVQGLGVVWRCEKNVAFARTPSPPKRPTLRYGGPGGHR